MKVDVPCPDAMNGAELRSTSACGFSSQCGMQAADVTFDVTVAKRQNPGKSLDCNFVTVALEKIA